ncbi:MAG: hypothetical protein JJT89_06075 [Nitriliruptoraceae bacterium]|nr:hypothetical protein [Nitriliruptoraceae bacterium]
MHAGPSTSERHRTTLVLAVLLATLLALAAWWSPAVGAGPTQPSAESPAEAVEVHGDWTVDVYEPDGTLAASHEFQNALTGQGPRALVSVMGGIATVQGWSVAYRCPGIGTNAFQECYLSEPGLTANFGGPTVNTLEVGMEGQLPSPRLVLEGKTDATDDFTMDRVATYVVTRTPFSGGVTEDRERFTQKLLAEPIDIQRGQQLVIRVEISFS